MKRKPYPSDLTDEQRAAVEPLIPPAWPGGRPREVGMREVLNALFYRTREGCTWRALPHDFPPWETACDYFRWFTRGGTRQATLDAAREEARARAGREPTPSAAATDSQSVKTAGGGKERGTDGGEKVKGRRRHIRVDTLGLLIAVGVTAADVGDGRAAPEVFGGVRGRDFPRLGVVYADGKYHDYDLYGWLSRRRRPYAVGVVSRPGGATGFGPLKVRWVVERTFAWLGRHRCLSKDYEHLPASGGAVVRLAAIHHMLRRPRPERAKRSERFRFKKQSPKRAA